MVTVLFADVSGSTSLGEQLDPERLREVMDTYFAAMREEIEGEGGTVEKFIGDAVMAAFGVPAAHEDDPGRALRAALRMQARLREVNHELDESHGVTLKIRIGVNTGEVLATNDPAPGEAMVTGDAVNVAARLEAAAEPDEILTSERTARAGRGFAFEDRGQLELKGKRDRVHAYLLMEETGGPARGVPGLRSPMIGRNTELGVLQSVYERVAAEGHPHLVTIYGDAGVGKSRLTQEFTSWAEDRDPTPLVLHGRCLPYGDGVTYWPLAEILKGHASVLDTDPPALALEKIRKTCLALMTTEVAADPVRATAALAFTVGLEDPDVPMANLDSREVREEVHAAWRSFFSALAGEGPLLTLVEDIHWADPALLDLIEELADRVQGPAMFLCPSRPDLLATRPGWGGGRRNTSSVALDPLGADDSESLVRHLLTIDDLPGSVHSTILERAEGNPFFLEEIVRRLIDEGLVVREEDRWRATTGITEVEIPDTVQAVLASRIDLLDTADKRVLQAAAVVGRVFWSGPVRLLAGTPSGGELAERFRRLEGRELVLSRLGSSLAGESEFIFKHVLTRDVAYESIPRKDRAASHATVAGWIEETAGERSREFVELLAHHYGTAVALQAETGSVDESLRERAFTTLVRASVDARSKRVLAKAGRMADEALAIAQGDAERTVALETLGEAFFDDYRGDLAWRYLRDAALTQLRVQPPDSRRIAYLVGRACDLPVRWPGSMRTVPPGSEVTELHAIGMAHLSPGDSAERAMLMANRAGWPFAFPEFQSDAEIEEAVRSGREAASMAERLGRFDLASAALDQAQGAFASRGLWGRALEALGERARFVPLLQDIFEVGDFYAMGAWGNYEAGRYAEALRYANEGISIIQGRGVTSQIHCLAWRVATRYRLGGWDEALADLEELRELLEDRRDDPPYFAAQAFAAASLVHQARGETAEADRLFEILRLVTAGNSPRTHAWLLRVLVERNQLEDARRVRENPPPSWRVHRPSVEEARLELAAATGDWSSAGSILADVRAYVVEAAVEADEAKLVSLPCFADRFEGRAAAANGDIDRAIEMLTAASDGFEALEAPYERARTDVDLARALAATGRIEEAGTRAATAAKVFASLGAVKDLAVARRSVGSGS